MTLKKVLVTGLAGKIGGIIRKNLAVNYELSGLDLLQVKGFETIVANLEDLNAIMPAFEGMDTVVHLAADPNHKGDWQSNLDNNIIGTRNVFEAARLSGVRRIIFASSNHALGCYFHDEYGLSVICIRIGWVMEPDDPTFAPSALSLWMSHRDTAQVIQKCIDAPETVGFAVLYGMSDNTYGIWDMKPGKDIVGFKPVDDAGTEWFVSENISPFMTSGDPQK